MIGIKKGVFFLAFMFFFSSLDGRKGPCPGRGLPLMEEKKQKKIKASPRPGKLAGYRWEWKRGRGIWPGTCGNGKGGTFFAAPPIADRYLSGEGFNIGARALLLQAILNNPAAHARDALHFLQI